MGVKAYNLNADNGTSRSFNVDLRKTTNELVEYLYSDPSLIHIRDFEKYITENKIERQRSTEEYFPDFDTPFQIYALKALYTKEKCSDIPKSVVRKHPCSSA